MHFDLSMEQRLLQESSRKFWLRECPMPRVRELVETDTGLDESLWRLMADQGWLGLTLPEAHGGLGLGLVELAVVAEEMGRACAPVPFISNLWAATLIAAAGGEPQRAGGCPPCRARLLEAIGSGSERATVAFLESGASWDPTSPRLELIPARAGFRLDGRKTHVMDAAIADHIVVAAWIEREPAILVVPRTADGVTVMVTPGIDLTRRLARIDFDDVAVSEADMLARGEDARRALEVSIRVGAVAASADLLGGMGQVLETTVEFAGVRQQFGKPIATFQAVQHQCADMLLMFQSARSATYYAAWALSVDDPVAARAVSIAKAYCSDAGREVGNRGVQVHGGIGFTWEHDLHLHYRRAKASELMFGDATWHRSRLASLIVDSPGSPEGKLS